MNFKDYLLETLHEADYKVKNPAWITVGGRPMPLDPKTGESLIPFKTGEGKKDVLIDKGTSFKNTTAFKQQKKEFEALDNKRPTVIGNSHKKVEGGSQAHSYMADKMKKFDPDDEDTLEVVKHLNKKPRDAIKVYDKMKKDGASASKLSQFKDSFGRTKDWNDYERGVFDMDDD